MSSGSAAAMTVAAGAIPNAFRGLSAAFRGERVRAFFIGAGEEEAEQIHSNGDSQQQAC